MAKDILADEGGHARLKAGEVIVEETRLDETGGTVRVAVLMNAPAETIWRVISNCNDARRYVAGMLECEVLVDEDHRALTHHVVDPGWLAPKMDYHFETRRAPHHRMDFELTRGNLRQMEGFWKLEEVDSGVRVEHELRIQPRAPAPRWLIRRKLKQDLPNMMACIRGLAGGSMSSEMAAEDAAACSEHAAAKAQ